MKRFLLFGGINHQPYGGAKDSKGCYLSADQAVSVAKYWNLAWFHVVDSASMKIVHDQPFDAGNKTLKGKLHEAISLVWG